MAELASANSGSHLPAVSPSLKPPIVVIAAGVVAMVGAFVWFVWGFTATLTAPRFDVPGATSRQLSPGEYVLYQQIGSSNRTGPITTSRTTSASIRPESVRVEGSSGRQIVVRSSNVSETLTLNRSIFVGVARFTVTVEDTYDIEVPDARPGSAIVGRSIVSEFEKTWKLIPVGVGGLLTAFGGAIWYLARYRRRHANDLRPVLSGPAIAAVPGWYPDVHQRGSLRWWDGTQWTEHRHSGG